MSTRRDLLKCISLAGAGIVWSVAGGIPRAINLGGPAEAAAERLQLCPNQRQPYRLQGRGQSRPGRHLAGRARQDRRAAEQAGDDDPYRRRHPFVEGRGVRYRRQDHQGRQARHTFHPRRARRHRRRRQAVLRPLRRQGPRPGRAGTAWIRAACISSRWSTSTASHRRPAPRSARTSSSGSKRTSRARAPARPIVVLAHIPLWSIYPQWGWVTGDADQAFTYLKPFGSVTVLNGHIHQVVQKVEGKVTFQTAMSTAFPQPKAGEAPNPGPDEGAGRSAEIGARHPRYRSRAAGRSQALRPDPGLTGETTHDTRSTGGRCRSPLAALLVFGFCRRRGRAECGDDRQFRLLAGDPQHRGRAPR